MPRHTRIYFLVKWAVYISDGAWKFKIEEPNFKVERPNIWLNLAKSMLPVHDTISDKLSLMWPKILNLNWRYKIIFFFKEICFRMKCNAISETGFENLC